MLQDRPWLVNSTAVNKQIIERFLAVSYGEQGIFIELSTRWAPVVHSI